MTETKQKSFSAYRKELIKWGIQSFAGWAAFAAVVFLSAGRLDWVWGWVLMVITGSILVLTPILLIPINPESFIERAKGLSAKGTKKWDIFVTAAATLCMVAAWIVGGLDKRFGWSMYPLSIHLMGMAIMIVGTILFLWAMISNAFFTEGVRIQSERQHSVCTQGPYRFVRHPGYVGSLLSQIATPLLLGSTWSIFPTILYVVLSIVRTFLEENTLKQELPGYREYSQQVRYRLIPGIW